MVIRLKLHNQKHVKINKYISVVCLFSLVKNNNNLNPEPTELPYYLFTYYYYFYNFLKIYIIFINIKAIDQSRVCCHQQNIVFLYQIAYNLHHIKVFVLEN